MIVLNISRTVLFLVALFTGCAGLAQPPPFPTHPDARKHYEAGEQLLEAQRYEMAAAEYEKSLQFESVAYITHMKLGVAYFGQHKFAEAARQFEETHRLWGGGPRDAPVYGILQAVTLQRAGNRDVAEKLLRGWSGPGIGVTPFGAFSAGGTLPRHWKVVAGYLLGSIDEKRVLGRVASSDHRPYVYLVIGIANAGKGDTEKAKKFLQLAADATRPGGWGFALARAEMRNLEK